MPKLGENLEREVAFDFAIFISVEELFAQILFASHFSGLVIGKEPWLHLSQDIAKGKSARGARSAKNFAHHAGVQIREWSGEAIRDHVELPGLITKYLQEWQAQRLILLGSFLNSTDPLAYPEWRRFFTAHAANGDLDGYLVVTQVKAGSIYFFEDLILRQGATKGVGELLIMSAAEALKAQGAERISLGVVGAFALKPADTHGLSLGSQFLLLRLPALFRRFYHFEGLETFRKRFKPREWKAIYLVAVRRDEKMLKPIDWLRIFWNLIWVFKPNLQWNRQIARSWILPVFIQFPLTWAYTLTSSFLFWRLNHGGDLPETLLARYGFFASAPPTEWVYRTLTSDWLFFNSFHFFSCLIPMIFFLVWAERTHSRRFLAVLLILISFFDDLISFYAIQKPFHFIQPAVFHRMALEKDVGPSLLLATLVGMQFCQIRKNRELYFVGTLVVVVLLIAYSSNHLSTLVLNLNHFLFLSLGYAIGKFDFEYARQKQNLSSRKRSA